MEKQYKIYRMKHIPTGLYFQPHKFRGSHLSKKGKIYQTNTNGLSDRYGRTEFVIMCQKDSLIHKITKDILNWYPTSYSATKLKCNTLFTDWIKEEIKL